MSFMVNMENELKNKKTLTDNGAVAYETAGSALLDFNFDISSMRNMSSEEISDRYMKVFLEDKLIGLEYLFYLADIREGLGERKVFRSGLQYLINHQTNIAKAVLTLIPHYNRWDSVLLYLENESTRRAAVKLIKSQLKEDKRNMKEGKPISLCAKWMPSINASSTKTRQLANILCDELGWKQRKYRKTLSKLRKYLDVVEVKMSANKWGDINYQTVPSRANLIYNNAFLKNDEQRRRAFLDSLKRGEAKINAGVLSPHEICNKYLYDYELRNNDTLEALWKSLPDLSVENTLVVRDGSASMKWSGFAGNKANALDVATALAIYMSEHNTGEWKDKYITFSASPKIVDLSKCNTLSEKLHLSMKEAECSNTNIYKTMKLILNTAVHNKMSQEEMPKMVVICSDMQFDGTMFRFDYSLFDQITNEYKDAGYKLPRICFWNLSGRLNNTVPMQQNEMGLILCSGFSVQILKMFMSNQIDPYKILVETLNGKRYEKVRMAVKDILQ